MKHKMIVAINIDNDIPHIEYLNFDSTDTEAILEGAGQNMKDCYDEVYIVEFRPYMTEFIEEIRKNGRKL